MRLSVDQLREKMFYEINNIIYTKVDDELIRIWKKAAAKHFFNNRHRDFLIEMHHDIVRGTEPTPKQLSYLTHLANNR